MSYDVYAGILKMMDSFQSSNKAINFHYDYHDSFCELEAKYELSKIAGNSSTMIKAINLMDWLSNNVYHDGSSNVQVEPNALALLEYSFKKGKDFGINCCMLSITLAECCLVLGLKARTVYIMPFSPYDGDNHVVCEVWISELNKWIVLDPTYNSYVMDINDNVLNIYELRTALANREKVIFSERLNYNGNYNQDKNKIIEYYAKDLFYFSCMEIHTFNSQRLNTNRRLFFVPIGYDVKKANLTNIDYRIENWGEADWLKKHKELTKNMEFIYCPIEELSKSPI